MALAAATTTTTTTTTTPAGPTMMNLLLKGDPKMTLFTGCVGTSHCRRPRPRCQRPWWLAHVRVVAARLLLLVAWLHAQCELSRSVCVCFACCFLPRCCSSSRVAELLAVKLRGKIKIEDAGFDWKILGPDVSGGW